MQTKLNTTETEGWIRILQKWQVAPIPDRVDVTLSFIHCLNMRFEKKPCDFIFQFVVKQRNERYRGYTCFYGFNSLHAFVLIKETKSSHFISKAYV